MPTERALRKIVEQFAGPRTRLLVTGQDRAARPTVEVAHEALIRTWPRLREWIDANREKLRSRAAVVQANAEWERQGRREDLLLPSGFALERARTLLADPGDLTTDDIQEFIALSAAREQAEHKRREADLARDEERVAEIKAAQARTARLQRVTRQVIAAAVAVILIAAGLVGWLQSDKAARLEENAQQLAMKEVQLTNSRESLDALKEQANREIGEFLTSRDHVQANLLAELSAAKLSRSDFDGALRLASRGTRIDLVLPADKARDSRAAAALATAVSQVNWRLTLGGHDDIMWTAAFSPDGSRIVTASADKTARIWDAVSGKEIAVLRGHEGGVFSAAFSPGGSRIVTASNDKTARVWDAASAKEIAVLRGHDESVNSAAFSPDGKARRPTPRASSTMWRSPSPSPSVGRRSCPMRWSPDGCRPRWAGWALQTTCARPRSPNQARDCGARHCPKVAVGGTFRRELGPVLN
jgi:WD domain, G-beta repeat